MTLLLDKINIALVITILLNLFLGVMVFFNGPKRKINVIYSFNILAIVSWVVAMFFYRSAPPESNLFWCTILYITPTFIASSFLYFTYIFPSERDKNVALKAAIIFLINLAIVVMVAWPNFIIKAINVRPGLEKEIIFTKFYIFYFLYTFCLFSFGFSRLFKKYRQSEGVERLQIVYLLIGYATAANLAFVTNLIMPWVGFFFLNWLGQVFTVIMVGFTSYAITRYNLMDIKVVATEFFSGLLILASLMPIFNAKNKWELAIRIVILAATIFFAVLIVRSVLLEIKRREIESKRRKEVELLNRQLKKATKELAAANKKLERLDEAKSEFLSIASHQLRTPLTVIKGYISMMLEGSFGQLPKIIKENLDKVYISSERLIGLVESLLNISRIEAGRMEFDLKPADLTTIAKSLVDDFQQKAKVKKLKLEFNSEPKLPLVLTDGAKIKEVISNLIDNAIKYTEKGEIMVDLHQESQSVVLNCQDTGRGIDPDDLPRLFNKFVRGKGMMQVNTEGTGLGLYFARKLIENLGGRIWVESPGLKKGSKFSFSLPLADKSQAIKIK